MQATALYSTLIVLVCCISFVTPLKCFVCSSTNATTEKPCGVGKDVHKDYEVDCNRVPKDLGGDMLINNWTVCRKIVTWVDYGLDGSANGIERVLRKCGYNEEKHADACFYRGGLGGRQRVCSCKTDSCNAAPKSQHGMSLLTILGASIPVFILARLFQ